MHALTDHHYLVLKSCWELKKKKYILHILFDQERSVIEIKNILFPMGVLAKTGSSTV